jgi:ribosomal protein L19
MNVQSKILHNFKIQSIRDFQERGGAVVHVGLREPRKTRFPSHAGTVYSIKHHAVAHAVITRNDTVHLCRSLAVGFRCSHV